MEQFPKDISFKYPWRTYQDRVLKELEDHLNDDHLHIIAPPGSGKTVLGLEVALRLNKPTLIVTPTIAIRNQWIQRFCELFLQIKETPHWITTDVLNPKFFTVLTYQSIHSAFSCSSSSDPIEDVKSISKEPKKSRQHDPTILKKLKAQNIATVVVDEAHHLKNAWWESLSKVKEALSPTIVGLTATPPYDVSALEWQRYIQLNGPVDAEISIPELVVEGDLCPHQDYVYLSSPTKEETDQITGFHNRIATLKQDLKKDQELIKALRNHPSFVSPNESLEWIYSNLSCYSSIIIFLNDVGQEITNDHLEVIGDEDIKVPSLDLEWLEVLLDFYLNHKETVFEEFESHRSKLHNKLKRIGAIERKTIKLTGSKKVNSFLNSSISKLKSIKPIVDFEYGELKHDLRMVILTDYIRKEYLVNQPQNDLTLKNIGVLPIFEYLRRQNNKDIKIGILTGSLIVIPIEALKTLEIMALANKITEIKTSSLPFDSSYVIVKSTEALKNNLVQMITQLFEIGQIEVLIGTKALLGEGWDAPAINALILASFVGSYVLSNQMRGRAIRTERTNIEKTGNIWHLVCVDPSSDDGGDDMRLLKRRFRTFVGVSMKNNNTIESGIERLNIPVKRLLTDDIIEYNDLSLAAAGNRHLLKKKWDNALVVGSILVEELKVPFRADQNYKEIKSLYYHKTIKSITGFGILGLILYLLVFVPGFIQVIYKGLTLDTLAPFLISAFTLGVSIFGVMSYKAMRLFIKYRDIAKDAGNIGHSLLETMVEMGLISTQLNHLHVVADVDQYGAIYCHLAGGTAYEKSSFIKALQEIIGTVENTRYIMIRKNKFLKIFSQKDYHPVPNIIGKKKEYATLFQRHWARNVGPCELIYTRTIEGRKLLLKARYNTLASEFSPSTERINKWR